MSATSPINLSVVAPCFNEASNLMELAHRICRVFDQRKIVGELVLVDDGSTDETPKIMEALEEADSRVRIVRHPRNRGIAAGWTSGIAAAQGQYVCLIDSDLQNLPEDVWRLYREVLFSNSDLVQGYRSSIGRLKDSRFILSKGLNLILNSLFGMRLRDNKSGFVIARRETLQDIVHHRWSYRYFQTFIAVAAHSKGYTIREIETLFEERLTGRSFIPKIPVKVVTLALWDIAKALFEFRILRKRESILEDMLKTAAPTRLDEPLKGWRKALFNFFFLTMPLHKWTITRRARRYYDELKVSQWLTPDQIQLLQERKLRKLVNHAYNHVAYYRSAMDAAGLRPEDIKSLTDLVKMPLLNKDAVRSNMYFDLLADNHEKSRMLRITTSGSTGEPMVLFADEHQLEIRWAATMRGMEWSGYRFGDRQARLWHQTLGMSRLQIFREKVDALLNRRVFIPAFEISEARLNAFISQLERHQPLLLDGYAESLNFLAEYLRTHRPPKLSLKAIISSAQNLPKDSRELIEKAFGCKVFDKYGSREFSGIAYECEAHNGHHIVAESYIVEVLRDGKPVAPGETGEVVITDLNNFCVPLIRYRLGDLAVAMDNTGVCSCGRGLPRIGEIQGRVQSIIVGSNGSYLPSAFFGHLLKDYHHLVAQYQIIQETREEVTLRIVKGRRMESSEFERLRGLMLDYLGKDTNLKIIFVDEIPLGRTGKRQGNISKVRIDLQDSQRRDSSSQEGIFPSA